LSPLCVAPHLDVTPVEDRGLVVLLPHGHEVFAGPEYAAVARALEGAETEEELISAAADGIAEADVRRAVDELRAAGVLLEHDGRLDVAEAAYWARDGLSPGEVAARLAEAAVGLAVVGDVDPDPVREALGSVGVRLAGDGELLLVLTDDYLRPELGERNAEALASGRPWALAAPAAADVWVGPVFVPDRGACWECLAQRLRRHRSIESYLGNAAGRERPIVRPGGSLAATREAAAGIAAAYLVRWLVLGRRARPEGLLTLDPHTWQATSHVVTRRPQCPACGFPEEALGRPAQPPHVTERARSGGRELRTAAPEVTVERFQHHVSPVTGAVSRLARAAGTRPPLHVYLAGDAGPRRHGADDGWPPGTTTVPCGKGTTDAQARASALGEALERYSGEFAGDEPRRAGTLAELAPAAIHPNDCMGFSQRQYERREETNAESRSPRTFVPVPFDAEEVVDWTPLWSLTHERERLLPTAYCYYSARLAGHEACRADSNGNAAGNTVGEAILHGLLELVERDHVALWWYNRLRLPGVDLEALADPWIDDVRARFDRDGRRLWALDLTADLGIPVVAALAAPSSMPGGIALGFGAHLDLRLAATRAVAELVQLDSGAPSAGAGHGPPEPVGAAGSAYLHPDDAAPTERVTEDLVTGDLAADLETGRRHVEGAGLDVLVLDQTRPDIGLPVVKVVVPGLRHFWPRFAPGRLYDVPVAMGWMPEPLAEDGLNPVPPVA
jgi:oxazoline/thiazoline synthase